MQVSSNETWTLRGLFDFSGGTLAFKDKQLPRVALAQTDDAPIAIPISDAKTWDAASTALPTTAAADDLGFTTGTFGTSAPKITTSDAKATTVTQKVRFSIPIDNQFYVGEDISLRVYCGMATTISDTTATIDAAVYVADGDGTVGSDICATAAQSINSLTNASKDFIITTSSLVYGDMLDVVLTIAITDGATGTAVLGEITGIRLLRDIR